MTRAMKFRLLHTPEAAEIEAVSTAVAVAAVTLFGAGKIGVDCPETKGKALSWDELDSFLLQSMSSSAAGFVAGHWQEVRQALLSVRRTEPRRSNVFDTQGRARFMAETSGFNTQG